MFGVLANFLSWCYQVWPNYAGMVLLFTLVVMLIVTPFTIKGMRSAAEMSRIQPEMKKIQDQYKNDRIKQNEEMQALFKEHGVNPLGGCLPTLLPLPIFFIIFRLLERMNARRTGTFAPLVRLLRHNVAGAAGYVSPHYLPYKATLTQAIVHSNGQLKAFGMDLAATAQDHHSSVGAAIPYFALIVVMTVSQYWQQRQINQRNPAAANANPQMKMTMQIFPAFYALISLRIPAAVVLYLLISGLFRMAQNSVSYRFDPVLARAAVPPSGTIEATSRPKVGGSKAALGSGKPAGGRSPAQSSRQPAAATSSGSSGSGASEASEQPKGFLAQLRAQAAEARTQADKARSDRGGGNGRPGRAEARAPAGDDARPDNGRAETGPPDDASDDDGGATNGAGQEAQRTGTGGQGGSAGPRSPLSVRPSGRVTPRGQQRGGKRSRRGR